MIKPEIYRIGQWLKGNYPPNYSEPYDRLKFIEVINIAIDISKNKLLLDFIKYCESDEFYTCLLNKVWRDKPEKFIDVIEKFNIPFDLLDEFKLYDLPEPKKLTTKPMNTIETKYGENDLVIVIIDNEYKIKKISEVNYTKKKVTYVMDDGLKVIEKFVVAKINNY